MTAPETALQLKHGIAQHGPFYVMAAFAAASLLIGLSTIENWRVIAGYVASSVTLLTLLFMAYVRDATDAQYVIMELGAYVMSVLAASYITLKACGSETLVLYWPAAATLAVFITRVIAEFMHSPENYRQDLLGKLKYVLNFIAEARPMAFLNYWASSVTQTPVPEAARDLEMGG